MMIIVIVIIISISINSMSTSISNSNKKAVQYLRPSSLGSAVSSSQPTPYARGLRNIRTNRYV